MTKASSRYFLHVRFPMFFMKNPFYKCGKRTALVVCLSMPYTYALPEAFGQKIVWLIVNKSNQAALSSSRTWCKPVMSIQAGRFSTTPRILYVSSELVPSASVCKPPSASGSTWATISCQRILPTPVEGWSWRHTYRPRSARRRKWTTTPGRSISSQSLPVRRPLFALLCWWRLR